MTDCDVTATHPWRFFRAGGFDQVLLESGKDMQALAMLDQKLWVALSCPIAGVEFDPRTLELIDTDRDGHIRVPEILGALSWLAPILKDHDRLTGGDGAVPLSAINEATEEGRSILASARMILANLGKSDLDCISVSDTCDSERTFAQTPFNGDGVVTTAATEDEALRGFIARIVECYGGVPDRSGGSGINREMVERFSTDAGAWRAWRSEAQSFDSPVPDAELLVELWHSVKDKIEDYFLRCRLAVYDERASVIMNGAEADLLALAAGNLATSGDRIAFLPISSVGADPVLDLVRGVNPAWEERMKQFRKEIALPLLGGEIARLTLAEWEKLKESFAPYEQWWSRRIDTPLAALKPAQLIAWEETGAEIALKSLIEKDLELQPVAEAMIKVEKLTRFCRDLYPLLNNFVSFRDFYTGRSRAIFQVGTLYLDGRSFDLCVRVTDIAKHATLAVMSRLYLIYCDCSRKGGAEKMTIAAAVTDGDADQLTMGRNGVFYDRKGLDWDATVVRLVEHPISIRQSFWEPYKRFGRMVGEQIHKVAAARTKAAEDKRAIAILQAGQKKEDPKQASQPAFDVARFAGIFAAIGLAVGAIGTACASVVSGFFRLMWWQMPLALIGIVLFISGPSVIIAWFKLRKRNLGPILDANGWAVNAHAKLNIPFGASLTGMARLPKGASLSLADPFAEKRRPWKLYFALVLLVLLAVAAWRVGWFTYVFGA
ncbi:MAG: hypothetical protein WCP20_11900 [Desulfuromonadales bacterium]